MILRDRRCQKFAYLFLLRERWAETYSKIVAKFGREGLHQRQRRKLAMQRKADYSSVPLARPLLTPNGVLRTFGVADLLAFSWVLSLCRGPVLIQR